MTNNISPTEEKLRALAAERILILDGAMGTMLQALKFDEAAFRGGRFADWPLRWIVRGNRFVSRGRLSA